jgi:activator of 2-hydroxyglutaryl-CoA dehydratase
MTGGVAKNYGVVKEISNELQIPVQVCPDPQITGALGAALLAYQSAMANRS